MTFLILTGLPVLVAVLLIQDSPRAPRRHRRSPIRPLPPPARRSLIRCHLALPLLEATA
ncbi:hypothetical protein ACFCWY_36170 [Streptomyces sp. NPDC056362]|uniref:hypothetical protein n=1 Tax=unclassified Streptomyces TaxID=2593676 RepID=UPI0035DAC796